MSLVRSSFCALIALSICIVHTPPAFALGDPVNSRLERLERRQANIRSRVLRNSRSNKNFGFGSRRAGVKETSNARTLRRKTLRPSRRELNKRAVSRSRTERNKSADKYDERLKRGLSSCGMRYKSRYDRNNCIRRITRGSRTFE